MIKRRIAKWLRKRFSLARLSVLALGLAGALLTTDLLGTVKMMLSASNVALGAIDNLSQAQPVIDEK